MKSFNNLFKIILDREVISKCIDRAAKGKRNRKEVIEVLQNKELHIENIRNILINGTFSLSSHVPQTVVERGKKRTIIKPNFRYELIIQHLIVYVLEIILLPRLYEYSCASIPKRGISYGKRKLERWLRKTNRRYEKDIWVYKLDIRHFFESIDREILKAKLSKIIRDKKFLDLCFKMIACSDVPGLPLGFVTSQWFANFYLDSFDRWIKQEFHIPFSMRYMDDVIMIDFDKLKFHSVRLRTQWRLKTLLHLDVKGDWQVFKLSKKRPIDFMGFKFYTNKTTLRKKTLKYTMRAVLRASRKDFINRHEIESLISRLGWMKQADTHGFFDRHIKPLISIKKLKKGVSRGVKILQVREYSLACVA